MLKHKLLFILFSVAICVPTRAADDSAAYNFLNTTSSSRIYGLGGINITTVEDNIEVADQNPALLGPEMGGWIDLNYMRYIADSNFAGVRYGNGIGAHGAWMAGLQYFGYGSIEETDVNGQVTGNFSPVDISLSGTISHDIFSRWRIGANVKLIYSSYGSYSALAVAADLGLNYYNPDKDLSVSIVGANIGGQIKRFDNISEKMPTDIRVGLTKQIGNLPLRYSVTLWNLTKWKGRNKALLKHVVVAADFVPSSKFYISIGYNYKIRSEMRAYKRNFFSGFTVGTGLSASRFNLGLALAQPHTGALTLMVNFGLKITDFIR